MALTNGLQSAFAGHRLRRHRTARRDRPARQAPRAGGRPGQAAPPPPAPIASPSLHGRDDGGARARGSRRQRRGQDDWRRRSSRWSTTGVSPSLVAERPPRSSAGRCSPARRCWRTSRWSRTARCSRPCGRSGWRRRRGAVRRGSPWQLHRRARPPSVARVLFILAISRCSPRCCAGDLGEPIRGGPFAIALALAGVAVMLGSRRGSVAARLAFLAALAFAVIVIITRWWRDVRWRRRSALAGDPRRSFLRSPAPARSEAATSSRAALVGGSARPHAAHVGARLILAAQVGPHHAARGRPRPRWGGSARRRRAQSTLVGGADRDRRDRDPDARRFG